jgi:hypothetical protein
MFGKSGTGVSSDKSISHSNKNTFENLLSGIETGPKSKSGPRISLTFLD